MSHPIAPAPGRAEVAAPSVDRRAPRVALIAAVARNRVIGAKGGMPWHLPEDLKHFRSVTLGHPVIMGRRTWESLGKPLPGRENIVVSRRPDAQFPGARVAGSLQRALELSANHDSTYVIGGAEIYALALPLADGLVLTEIDRDFPGDTFFPEWDRAAFRETRREARVAGDLRFAFVTYERAAP